MTSFLRQSGAISGKLVVPLLFGGALLVAGAVFLVGYREKRQWDHIQISGPGGDSLQVTDADSLRHWLQGLPLSWVQVTPQGGRLTVVVPCFSEAPSLLWQPGTSQTQERPFFICPFCEAGDTLRVNRLQVSAQEPREIFSLHLAEDTAAMDYLPQGNPGGGNWNSPTLRWVRGLDTAWFAPADSNGRFDMVRAEEENPEGCRPDEVEGDTAQERESP